MKNVYYSDIAEKNIINVCDIHVQIHATWSEIYYQFIFFLYLHEIKKIISIVYAGL